MLNDLRPNSANVFKQLLSPRMENILDIIPADKTQARVNLQFEPNHTYITIQVDHPRIFLIPEPLIQLQVINHPIYQLCFISKMVINLTLIYSSTAISIPSD